ncbi:hypothetical protein P691DRAFT_501399 [Macrolepiota fuliginosa MF-IS2]|uniref:Uncharacterized protein n=1 Tax=Macrolepiota fuliginosa MF-IS2 TaxID=1400762 RepID=A0A9P5X058_9AGAR|nr:hypothetical protein P691DRAFT_501399 [Macrolepiota fuliginosa MF-IS2]
MLQTTIFSLYIALSAGEFSAIKGCSFNNTLYWADYTRYWSGFGLPVNENFKRTFSIHRDCFVVSSTRGLVLERGKVRITKSHLETAKAMRSYC